MLQEALLYGMQTSMKLDFIFSFHFYLLREMSRDLKKRSPDIQITITIYLLTI